MTVNGGSLSVFGTGASASILGDDFRGVVTLNTGTGASSSGELVIDLSNSTFWQFTQSLPRLEMWPADSGSSGKLSSIDAGSIGTGAIGINFTGLADSSTYKMAYHIA